ncbi:tape measure protein [Corynebacterium minutissimum]|uniref:tape measure protein n=1 Tax=Corynebacterium minutissimum TaxID=38301 RepID=UPI001EF2C46C|nr:tape measure protein [Corynebacterium minutissimum]MCG7239566.1 tape measure protein [Corynebacterium minutissimum]
MAELGVGYISIVPEVSKISPGIAEALGATTPVAEKSGKTMGAKLSSGINKTLKASAIGIGTTAGGFIAAGLTKGFGRLQAIEGAQSKLTGLGSSAQQVSGIMDNALAAVKGTAHGLGEAASVSAQMVAAGIEPGKQLEQTLKTVGDTAAIAGRSMEDLGLIFGSVAARGKLQGDDMLQLMSSGIPVLQLLSKELGVTSAEVSEMVSDGKVDFATFEKAMREGMGGAALEMGDTFTGAVANMGAAAGRVGATALDPFFDLSKEGFGAVTKALDGFGNRLGPVMEDVDTWLQKRGVPAVKAFAASMTEFGKSAQVQSALNATKTALSQLWETGQKLLPIIGSLVQAFGKASASLGVGLWKSFASVLTVAGAALEAIAGPLGSVADFLSRHPALVTAAVGAWAGFKTIPNLISKATGAINPHVSSLKTMGAGVKDLKAYYSATGREISTFGAAVQLAATSNNKVVASMARAYDQASAPAKAMASGTAEAMTEMSTSVGHSTRSVSGSVKKMSGTVKGVGAAAFTGLKSAAGSVMALFGGPWGLAVAGASAAIASVADYAVSAKQAEKALAESASKASDAHKELAESVAGTSGALSETGLTAAIKLANAELAELEERGKLASKWQAGLFGGKNTYRQEDYQKYRDEGFQVSDARQRARWDMEGGYKQLQKTMEEMKISKEQLDEAIASGGPAYDDLIAQLRSAGTNGEWAADRLKETRDSVQQSVDAARNLDPAMVAISNAMGVLADESSSAQDKLAALSDIMDKLTGGALSHDEAQAKLVEDVQETSEAVAEMAGKLSEVGPIELDPDGTIDATTEAGKEAVRTISEMAHTMLEAASNGVSVDEIFDQQADNLTALQESLGLTDDQFKKLMESYGLVREIMGLPLAMEGAETIEQQIDALELGLSKLEEGKSIQVTPPDPAVAAALEDIGFKVEHLDDGNIEITATADVDAGELDNLGAKVKEIDGLHAKAIAELDTTMFSLNAEQAKQLGHDLDGLEVSAQADLTIDKLLQGKDVAVGELQALAKEVSTPSADLDKMLLDAGVEDSKVKLANLNEQKTKPTIDVNAEPAKEGINAVSRMLRGLKDKVINIFTNNHGGGSRSGRFADGAVVSAHRYLAAGGAGRLSQQSAQIASGGRWITWAEDETQGESFIPHAPSKRKRSKQILAETANIFGLGLVDANGAPVRRDGSSVAPTSATYMADGGVSPGQLLRYFKGELVNGQQASRSLQDAPYVFGGSNWGDCSSTQGQGALFAVGEQADRGRFMSTADEKVRLASIGFSPGLGSGPRYAIGWLNGGPGGGHTSGTIHFEDGHSVNVEMGGGAGGQGKIGGAAAGAAHPQYSEHAHLPLSSLSADMQDIDSTSVDGFTTKSGKSVSWGKAQEYYDLALDSIKRTKVYDNGGILESGKIALNLSGKDERILTNAQTRIYEESLKRFPQAAKALEDAAKAFDNGVADFVKKAAVAQEQTVSYGYTFGGDYLGKAEIVRDAEQGLLETRRAIAEETDEVSDREKDLAEAKRELSKVESEGAGLTKAQKRKLADAEENLAKARKKGKADKIADAEKRLARAREDVDDALQKSEEKNAKAVAAAQKKVNKAEDALNEAREQTADQSDRLLAAERAIAAARYHAAGELASRVADAMSTLTGHFANFFESMSKLAGVVDQTRDAVANLVSQLSRSVMETANATAALQAATFGVTKTRNQGLIELSRIKADAYEAARNAAMDSGGGSSSTARWGSTSVSAMGGAMDRYRNTGVFALEKYGSNDGGGGGYSSRPTYWDRVTEQVELSAEAAKKLEADLRVQRARNSLAEMQALVAKSRAQLHLNKSVYNQSVAARLLRLQTSKLADQTAALYGLTKNEAQGAAIATNGVSRALGGLGKIATAVATGVAGFAAGGPLGVLTAIPSIIAGIGGVKDVVTGVMDVVHNKDDLEKAWEGMSTAEKVVAGIGTLGSTAATAVGAVASTELGPEAAAAGAEVGASIADLFLGGMVHNAEARVGALERDYADRIDEINWESDQQNARFEEWEAMLNVQSQYLEESKSADVETAELMRAMLDTQDPELLASMKSAIADTSQYSKKMAEQSGLQLDQLKSLSAALENMQRVVRDSRLNPSEMGQAMAAAMTPLMRQVQSPTSRQYEAARV